MIKNYHAIQQWDNWLTQYPGASILELEKNFLAEPLKNYNDYKILLMGSPNQYPLLNADNRQNAYILTPLIHKNLNIKNYIECGFYELGILSGSVDLVILPHTLELVQSPQKLLNEACRTVKPSGSIIIMGFNPTSLWGVRKTWQENHKLPKASRFLSPNTINKWLGLADFEFIKKDMLLFRPPIENQKVFEKLNVLETLGAKSNAFFGGIYVITAKAKHIPLIPIKLHWKQTLSQLSVTTLGPTMRELQ